MFLIYFTISVKKYASKSLKINNVAKNMFCTFKMSFFIRYSVTATYSKKYFKSFAIEGDLI